MIKGFEAVLASLVAASLAGCTPDVVGSSGSGGGGGLDASCALASCTTSTTDSCGATCSSCSACCATSTTTSCCTTPLVLSFDGAPVVFVADERHGFALSANESVATDWPTAATPWLALDRDGDGAIGDGGELFGSATRLANGAFAKNGFEALAELDENHDGRIDAADPAFARLVLWRDRDADRTSARDELEPAARSLVAIDLRDHPSVRCDDRGNCEVERAAFWYQNAAGELREGAVIDVHIRGRR